MNSYFRGGFLREQAVAPVNGRGPPRALALCLHPNHKVRIRDLLMNEDKLALILVGSGALSLFILLNNGRAKGIAKVRNNPVFLITL